MKLLLDANIAIILQLLAVSITRAVADSFPLSYFSPSAGLQAFLSETSANLSSERHAERRRSDASAVINARNNHEAIDRVWDWAGELAAVGSRGWVTWKEVGRKNLCESYSEWSMKALICYVGHIKSHKQKILHAVPIQAKQSIFFL